MMSARASRASRWSSALAAVAGLAIFWLGVLPWLSSQASIRRHVDSLHAADVNASAMFYSELECSYLLRR